MQAGATPPFLCPSDGRAKAHRSYISRDPRVSSARTIQLSSRLNRINPSMSAGIGRFPAERLPLHKSLARAWAGPPAHTVTCVTHVAGLICYLCCRFAHAAPLSPRGRGVGGEGEDPTHHPAPQLNENKKGRSSDRPFSIMSEG